MIICGFTVRCGLLFQPTMSEDNSLLDGLSRRFELTEEQEQLLVSSMSMPSSETATGSATTSIIGLSTSVSTFVANKSFSNFAVPQFASHWGVVCDFTPESRTLFHLLFDSTRQKVFFDATNWKDEWTDKHAVTKVGMSSYGYPNILKIGMYIQAWVSIRITNHLGNQLTNTFQEMGSYHLLFWNCQNFAKVFLRLICHDPPDVDFKNWGTADITRLVNTQN